jgi:hypothetical protein
VYNVDDIKDPLKGRPPNKRLKAFNEENKVGVKRMKRTNVSCEK